MRKFWRKPEFRMIFFVVLASILISLSLYLFRDSIRSLLPPALLGKPQTAKPGSCLILEEKYCSKAEVIKRQTAQGLTIKQIGFRLPARAPLFMPVDNQVTKAKLNDEIIFYKGSQAVVFNPNNHSTLRYKFIGDLQFENMLSLNMKKGEVFGYIQDEGIEMLGYNLVFYIADIGSDNMEEENIEEMKKLFPKIEL